ncbi:AraC family ligand binding domain-containing protein [Leptolyngbya sp. AN02str]|uniref:helix-turn-helix domain-containing protein n=1 Tax=Leptolyngbya sp. AN02str TaxID=3423363 RepID=UPI003D3201D2
MVKPRGMNAARSEHVKFWRDSRYADLELLYAHYITHSFARHTHDTFAIGVIMQGAEAFVYRGAQYVAPTGHVVVINPGEVHTGSAATEMGWTYRMLYPAEELLRQAATETWGGAANTPYFAEPVIWDEDLRRSLLLLHAALEHSDSPLEQDSRMVWTLAQMVQRHAIAHRFEPSVGRESGAVQRVQRYLHDHFAQSVTLNELAAIANLSPYYFLRTFRRQTGLPPHEYLNQVRLRQAKVLLRRGWAIADVAHHAGFSDQSHLTRQFKRMMGVTPGQYRQSTD